MAASHLLAHIEKQGILSPLSDVQGALKNVSLAYLLLTTFCGGDVNDVFLGGCIAVCLQNDAVVGRIEIYKAVVIPQYAIALVREHHRHTNLGIHLCQATSQTADVAVSVLKLSQAEEIFVLRRRKGQLCLCALHRMFCGGEDRCAACVLYRQQLLLGIDVNIQAAVVNSCGAPLIKPVRKTSIIEFFLIILYADSIMSHRGYLQESVTKVLGSCFLLCKANDSRAEQEHSENNLFHFV